MQERGNAKLPHNHAEVTVLMAVHKVHDYLGEAIESILQQTYKDFVFLIVDDGSTDETAHILEKYQKQDARIRVHRCQDNQGLGYALCEGVKLADSEFIARMDDDDIALPNRLEKQLSYLKSHPDIDILGTSVTEIKLSGEVSRQRNVPTEPEDIARLIWACPILHPTVMFRRSKILEIGNYNPKLRRRQDYDLWFRAVAAGLRFANLNTPLVQYRFSEATLRRNSLRAAWQQLGIGWRGCRLTKAPLVAYIGIWVPFLTALIPAKCQHQVRKWLCAFDPRHKKTALSESRQKKSLFFLVTEDWYFYSHRLPMAHAAMDVGYDVSVVANEDKHRTAIEQQGIRFVPFNMVRQSLSPLKAFTHIYRLCRLYKREKPHVVHHVGMKPILYGAIAAWYANVPHMVNAFAGLGHLFTAQNWKAKLMRVMVVPLLRFFVYRKNGLTLLQNKDDLAVLKKLGITDDARSLIIPGSGIDLETYTPQPLPTGNEMICLFAGRMIDIKGLPTLKQAFAQLEKTRPHIKLWLCGQPDPANPGSWREEDLRAWAAASTNIVYKGHQTEMSKLWGQAHVAVQASWGGEGIPKSLLEAAACGRAIVATDVPGCREVVSVQENGLLVSPHDVEALAQAIAYLADNPQALQRMAAASRSYVEKAGFSSHNIKLQTAAIYRRLLEK